MEIKMLENEYWYGTAVAHGREMPLHKESHLAIDLRVNQTVNQTMPLLVSSKGRYLWHAQGFYLQVENGLLISDREILLQTGFDNLKGAYLAAMANHFPFSSSAPNEALFEKIIYNTWIELTFFQSQAAVLTYAKGLIDQQLPTGVLMIDDGWSNSYGDWRFHSGNFPQPKQMISELKALGFEVMVWVCPFVTADTVAYREAAALDILIKAADGQPLITKWWNGYSAVLDLSHPQADAWLTQQLDQLLALGIAGFKFDAGDSLYYPTDMVTFGNTSPDEQSNAWANFGSKYSFNEFRVTAKAGGYPLLQRLSDKDHAWGATGIASLIPDTLLQGITGHAYSCPDMIGGGEYLNFQEVTHLDQELFVRHAEIACLLPAMQFSAAPYHLDPPYLAAIQRSLAVRQSYLPEILELVAHAQQTGEPIIRYLSYEFPAEPVEIITDQFMLGADLLVAPIYQKGHRKRHVYLPKGRWTLAEKSYESKGERVEVEMPLGVPAVFRRHR